MSTFADVVGSLKSRAALITMLPAYWDRDAKPTLPDTPAPFVFLQIEVDPARFVEFGAGRGSNLQRIDGELQAFVFIPRDWGLEQEAVYGEHVAAAFRSFRDVNVSCGACGPQPVVEGSSLAPAGVESEIGNYVCSLIAVPLFYDQRG